MFTDEKTDKNEQIKNPAAAHFNGPDFKSIFFSEIICPADKKMAGISAAYNPKALSGSKNIVK